MRPRFEIENQKIGIIGFNARPIACSVKRAGAESFVSDYWGDTDLAECSTDWVAVLTPEPNKRQRGSLEATVHESLSKNMLDAFGTNNLDSVLIGSGFDDHSEFLKPISKKWRIAGNSPEQFKKARLSNEIDTICEEFSIHRPLTYDISSVDESITIAEEIRYPLLVRKRISGGGSGIHLVRTEPELVDLISPRLEKGRELRVQEYINGMDISSSILSTGKEAITLSIQSQLIGLPTAGRNCDFVYCGNFIPLKIDDKLREKISLFSETLCDKLGLLGSNGIDFVLTSNNTLYMMEVNPRLQGTLEMLEIAGDISIIKHHYQALNGILPDKIPEYKPTVKMILYASKTGIVPDLSTFANTFDRTPPGIQVFRGDPICTIIERGASIVDTYRRVYETANAIQRSIM
jgi:predicted ATP-grasp superfamily ATP-dependent carboligase